MSLVALLMIAGCATTREDPAASPRAGCEITGGDWNSASKTCHKR